MLLYIVVLTEFIYYIYVYNIYIINEYINTHLYDHFAITRTKGEVLESFKKKYSFRNRGRLDRNILSAVYIFKYKFTACEVLQYTTREM
jgi:hypothetical protein